VPLDVCQPCLGPDVDAKREESVFTHMFPGSLGCLVGEKRGRSGNLVVDVEMVPEGCAWAKCVVAPSQDDLGTCLFCSLGPGNAKTGRPRTVPEGAKCYTMGVSVLIVELWREKVSVLDGTEDMQPPIEGQQSSNRSFSQTAASEESGECDGPNRSMERVTEVDGPR
jgi:hypothetical protein